MSDFIEFFGKLNTHQLRSLIREFNHQDVLKSYFRLNKADLLNAMSQVYSYKNGVISINKTLPKNLLGFLNKSGIKKVRYSQEPINITAGKTEVPKNTDLQTVNLGVNYSKKEAKLASQSVVSETPQTGHRTNKELMNKIADLEKKLADTQTSMIEKKETAPSAAPVFKEPKKVRARNDATNMGVKPVEEIPEPVKQVETTPVDDALTIKATEEEAGLEPDTKPIEELTKPVGKEKRARKYVMTPEAKQRVRAKIDRINRRKNALVESQSTSYPADVETPIQTSEIDELKRLLKETNERIKLKTITNEEGARLKATLKNRIGQLIGVPDKPKSKQKQLALPAPETQQDDSYDKMKPNPYGLKATSAKKKKGFILLDDTPKPVKEKKKVFRFDSDDESEILTPEEIRKKDRQERESRINAGTKKFVKS